MSLQRRNNEIWQLREGGQDLDTPSDTPSNTPYILKEVEKFGRACIRVALLFETLFYLRIYGR